MNDKQMLNREMQRAEREVASWPQWKQDAMRREATRAVRNPPPKDESDHALVAHPGKRA